MRYLRCFFCLVLALCSLSVSGQTAAQRRATRLGLGMNLSYLEGYWNGTKARHFSDFVKLNQVGVRKQQMADMARAGFKSVRIPVCFGAWASIKRPYVWENPEFLAAPDSLVRWALTNNLTAIIDLHHVEFDGSIAGADSVDRVVWLWQQIAERYKNTDPERVLFELRNEPHDITAQAWRSQASRLISTVRAIAPNHTMVVGFHDWNGRDALLQSDVFADPNIIYTFHFYDPFVFTHQGATWAGSGLPDLQGIPFPANPNVRLSVPAIAKGTWIENALNNYGNEATYNVIFQRIVAAKAWSTAKDVPIFLGEFGSYNLRSAPDSRCRHAEAIYIALGKLQIPSAWWEWSDGFSMLTPGRSTLMPCMNDALIAYATGELKVLETDPVQTGALQVYPNPAQTAIRIISAGAVATSASLTDEAGRTTITNKLQNSELSVLNLATGVYFLTVYSETGAVIGIRRMVKL